MSKNSGLVVEVSGAERFHVGSSAEISLPTRQLSPEHVEAALVEAWRLWRRSSGGGRWPFASDGPWHLISREGRAGDWDARGVDGEAPPPRETGLSIDEVARRDRVSGWLALVPEVDRRLVTAVVEQLGRGASRPDWMALRSVFRNRNGAAYGATGLLMRYRRALKAMARRVSVV